MTQQPFVPIESFNNSFDAELAKNWLNDAGVFAIVEGANVGTVLSYVGSAIAGARVLVPQSELAKAIAILQDFHESKKAQREPWICGECDEENEPGFDLCWKCGRDRVDCEKVTESSTHQPPVATSSTDSREASHETQSAHSDNPYQSPLNSQDSLLQVESEMLTSEEAEEMVLRAWRSAMLGVAIPLLLSIYSIVLLLSSLDTKAPLSKKGRRMRMEAWIVNLILLLFVFLFSTYYVYSTIGS